MQRTVGYLSGSEFDFKTRADYHEIRINVKVKSNKGLICPITIGSYIESDEDAVFMNKLLITKQKPLPELFWDLFEKGELSVADDLGSLSTREISYPTKRMKKVINEESIKKLAGNIIQTNDIVIEPPVKRLQSMDFKIVSPQTPITRTILDKYSLKNVAYDYLKLNENIHEHNKMERNKFSYT